LTPAEAFARGACLVSFNPATGSSAGDGLPAMSVLEHQSVVAARPQLDRRAATVACIAVLLLQFALVSWTFPLRELLTENPLFYIDGAYHWLQMRVAHELADQGRLTGYDPFFAAGNLGGVTLNASGKMPALLAILANGHLTEIQAYKLFVFVASVIGPVMVPIAARLAGADSRTTWIATALATCAWWASSCRWYHTAGMVSFILACFFALPYVALVARAIHAKTLKATTLVLLGGLGALALFLHPLFPIPVALLTLAHLAGALREIDWKRTILLFAGVSALSLLPNLGWILGMLRSEATIAGVLQYQTRVDVTTIPKELLGLWRGDSMGAKLYIGLFVASIAAALGASSASERTFARASLGGWALVALFAAVGAALPGAATVQPNRFSSSAYLFLLVPAAIGISVLILWLRTPVWQKRAAGLALGGICSVSFAWSAAEVAREVSYAPVGHYGAVPPEVRPLGEKSQWLLGWLGANTTAEGRVLFETSMGRIHDRAHMAGYYALTSNREFIGGPYPFMFQASYWDGTPFNKPIESTSRTEFARDLRVYNIGWIVVHTAASKRYLASQPGVVESATHDDLTIFRVEQPLDFFLAGSGRVEARRINRLVLSDLKGEEVVVKYHFVKGLKADPPVTIEPFQVAGAARPFVRLRPGGVARVELSVQ
jgi:hypothetical protein